MHIFIGIIKNVASLVEILLSLIISGGPLLEGSNVNTREY